MLAIIPVVPLLFLALILGVTASIIISARNAAKKTPPSKPEPKNEYFEADIDLYPNTTEPTE